MQAWARQCGQIEQRLDLATRMLRAPSLQWSQRAARLDQWSQRLAQAGASARSACAPASPVPASVRVGAGCDSPSIGHGDGRQTGVACAAPRSGRRIA
jgi:hypothetical protein